MSVRRTVLAVTFGLGLLQSGVAQPLPAPDLDAPVLRHAPLPDAITLMQDVRRQLPPQPLNLTGFIQTRDQKSNTRITRTLHTELRFGAESPYAVYHLSNGDLPPESLKITWQADRILFEHKNGEGEPTSPAPLPQDLVSGTGITWSDLSLNFLWWPDAKTIGRDTMKTRPCFIVELTAPEPGQGRLRAWIDSKARFVVKAELMDPTGTVVKKIEVDSIKEIEKDRWMVKDLEVRDYANRNKTLIRITEVEDLSSLGETPVQEEPGK